MKDRHCHFLTSYKNFLEHLLTYKHDNNDSGGRHAGCQGDEGRGHELLDDGGRLLDHLHLHVVVPDIGHILNCGGKVV